MPIDNLLDLDDQVKENKGYIAKGLLLVLAAIATSFSPANFKATSASIGAIATAEYRQLLRKYDTFIGSPVQNTLWNFTQQVYITMGPDAVKDPVTGNYVDFRQGNLPSHIREKLASNNPSVHIILGPYNGACYSVLFVPEDTSAKHYVYKAMRIHRVQIGEFRENPTQENK